MNAVRGKYLRKLLVLCAVLTIGCATSQPQRIQPSTISFHGTTSTAFDIAQEALISNGISPKKGSPELGYVIGEKGAHGWSWGENVAVFFREVQPGTILMWVESKAKMATNLTATDWTQDVLQAIRTQIDRLPKTPPAELARPDTLFAVYPAYRIYPSPSRVCVFGTGEGKDDITSWLTKGLIELEPPIKVIEPGNLEAVFRGKILEHATGLSPEETQALSQMLQVDYILFFQETISPLEAYRYGGRFFDQVNLKIFNSINGEVVFQTTREHGVTYSDLRQYGGFSHRDPNLVKWARAMCIRQIAFELRYALGYSDAGILFSERPCEVEDVLVNSPAHKAGLKKGDKIIAINDMPVSNPQDMKSAIKKFGLDYQGLKPYVTIERNGTTSEIVIELPSIPMSPSRDFQEEKKEKNNKGDVSV